MELFKGNHKIWFVIVENAAEKRQLFELIPKRNTAVYYYHPNGKKREQFVITPEEADIINKNWRNVHG